MSNVDMTKPPYRSTDPVVKSKHLFCGTLLAKDLKKSRKFYEQALGLECVEIGEDRMLARPVFNPSQEKRQFPNFVLDIRQSDEIQNPQRVFHHWGLELESKKCVDQMHDFLMENKEEFELQQVLEKTFQHSAYSFYFSDRDSNWWEFQFLPPATFEKVFTGDAV
ncbi:MAG: hypothetical protein CL589_18875 [Alteromonadaceae bacterium]|nr:hypothetical protein [Alteromonadaceae bacterium]|tara:strand:+ start:2719 stop:3213 length:495 start_codon:yes stop_codon:yes gene_type:complete